MPHINKGVVEFLFKIAEAGGYDAVVPKWQNGMFEALHSVYRTKQMLDAVKKVVRKGENKILAPLSRLKKVKFVPVNKIKEIDSELKTFTNINTKEDLEMKSTLS
jgi:molybdopterin-guanine dinucleotide biosynthesis protein A